MRLALVSILLSGCGAFGGSDCPDDPSARHHAKNPATNECWEFESSCEVPPSWPDCDGDTPDAGGPGTPDARQPGTPDARETMPDATDPTPDAYHPPDADTSDTCSKTIECDPGELCPAEWGGPADCRVACFSDFDCVSGYRCNNWDLAPDCPQPNWKPDEPGSGGGFAPGVPLIACAGWCVPTATP
jgi:hypothetical protein